MQDNVKVPINVYMGVDPADTDIGVSGRYIHNQSGVLPSKAPGRELNKLVISISNNEACSFRRG
jgi:hypothetical protein